MATPQKEGPNGDIVDSGKTHRAYYLDISADDASIKVPDGCTHFTIENNAQALAVEVYTGKRAGVEARASRRLFAASAVKAMSPVGNWEYINISHQDGSTNIGVLVILMEGANLPDTLTVTDEG